MDIVSLLLSHGASTETEDPRGHAAMTLAAASDHLSIVQLLLENCATSDLFQKHKETALFSAMEAGYT
jgi:ankyrin repeat protein